MTTLVEGNLRITLPRVVHWRKLDDPATHGLLHRHMKAVDFVVEMSDRMLFLEVKDPEHPEAPADRSEGFIRRFLDTELDTDLVRKFRDSPLRVGVRAGRQTHPLLDRRSDREAGGSGTLQPIRRPQQEAPGCESGTRSLEAPDRGGLSGLQHPFLERGTADRLPVGARRRMTRTASARNSCAGACRQFATVPAPATVTGSPDWGSRSGSRHPRRSAGCRGRGCRPRPSAAAPGAGGSRS